MLELIRNLKNKTKLIIYKTFYVLQTNRSKIKRFDESIFKGKKVIIIGPAETSLSYMLGSQIDKFDYIVRVNKSPLSLAGNENDLGSRTDILYHCFSEDPIEGGGRIDLDILSNQRNKYIVYTYSAPQLEKVFYKTVLRKKSKAFYRTNEKFFNEINKYYPAKWPTTGLQAILHLMSCDFEELHITGFTFFRTNYMQGYTTDEINSSAESRKKQIEKSGSHSFDGELSLFIKYFNENKYKNIHLDKFLSELTNKEID